MKSNLTETQIKCKALTALAESWEVTKDMQHWLQFTSRHVSECSNEAHPSTPHCSSLHVFRRMTDRKIQYLTTFRHSVCVTIFMWKTFRLHHYCTARENMKSAAQSFEPAYSYLDENCCMCVEIRLYMYIHTHEWDYSGIYLNPKLKWLHEVLLNNMLDSLTARHVQHHLNFLCHCSMNETPLTFPYLGGNVYFPVKSLSSFFPRLLHLQQCFEILCHSGWHYQMTQIRIYQT